MRVLSLFDGMACGMLAMLEAGIDVERYVAFEIDKYAIKSATHNFPMIEERGDVFEADFTEFRGFDFLVGGSPCTYWSIAKNTGRETESSGMGWELFNQYVRALHEAQPRWFIYENNKSMSNAIRESITETFGFEPICINSALVSAQNRQRLYWVGRRNEDGTYSKVDIEQPEDRGILLKDVLDGAMVAEPVNVTDEGKAWVLKSQYYKNNITNILNDNSKGCRFVASGVAEPVCVAERGRYKADGSIEQHFEAREDGKTNVLTTVQKDNNVCEPVNITADGKVRCIRATYYKDGIRNLVGNTIDRKTCAAEPAPAYATPCEWDENGKPVKAISAADGKTYTVYEVKDGQITIKGKRYAIKLADGYYIIRKLTVSECKRLQTVPEWYDFSVVSDSQAFRQLGNGWTILIISHLLTACLKPAKDEDELYCDTEGNYRFF